MYHDSGVGNSRSIRNADTYSMAGTSGHIPPLRISCRIVARDNRISREQPPKQRRPKIAGVYVAGDAVTPRCSNCGNEEGNGEEDGEKKKKPREIQRKRGDVARGVEESGGE